MSSRLVADTPTMTRNVWLAAAAITLGFLIAEYVPGRAWTFYVETLGPFLGIAWLGHVLTHAWGDLKGTLESMESHSLRGIVAVFAFLLVLGGFRLSLGRRGSVRHRGFSYGRGHQDTALAVGSEASPIDTRLDPLTSANLSQTE